MRTPNISVVAPVRGRIQKLALMLESLFLRAAEPERVEVILRCDSDDRSMIDHLRSTSLTFIVGPRKDGYASIATFINEGARLSHADLILVVNDDAEFVTLGWDRLLIEAAARYPDGIFDLGVTTELNDGNFVFPCTSRRVINLIGVHDDRLIYNDIWLRDVMAAFGRAIRVPEVTVRHRWDGPTEDQEAAFQVVHRVGYAEMYARCVTEAVEKIRRDIDYRQNIAFLQEQTC